MPNCERSSQRYSIAPFQHHVEFKAGREAVIVHNMSRVQFTKMADDGKELFYVTPDRKLMSVEVKTGGVFFERTTPRALFELRANVAATSPFVYRYAPSADGKRFLVSTDIEASAEAPPLVVVVNWLEGVKK